MKNLVFFLSCLFITSLVFAQPSNNSASISISDDDNHFSISASQSQGLPTELKTMLQDELGPVSPQKKVAHWEKEVRGDIAYTFKVSKNDCHIFLDKALLSKMEYNQLIDLSNDVLDLLNEDQSKRSTRRATPPTPPTPPSGNSRTSRTKTTKTTTTTTRTTDGETSTDLHFDHAAKKGSSSISISEEIDVYIMKASFNTKEYEGLKEKIEATVTEKQQKKGNRYLFWEKKVDGERAYRILLRKKSCKVFLERDLLSEEEYQTLVKLAEKIAHQIQYE